MVLSDALVKVVPAVAGAIAALVLVVASGLFGTQRTLTEQGLILVGVLAGIFATVAIFKFALRDGPGAGALAGASDPDVVARNRIAPFVLGIGTAGIVAVGLAVIVALATRVGVTEASILSIFSTIVPVFATWVGAVIAFYFSNESFRQAAESTGTFFGSKRDEPLTARMMPYEKITKLVLGEPFPTPQGGGRTVDIDYENVPMSDVRLLFGDTISRVMIFDRQRKVKVIVRQKLDDPDDASITTVKEYLERDQNKVASFNFMALPATASLEDAKRIHRLYGVLDIFVTDTGSIEEPAQGWISDDKLK